ncbi:helix-turn-helix transcriptional regulator [Alsobacter soli]|nr:AraC family transcriptional regulator [Alsobacter soli]
MRTSRVRAIAALSPGFRLRYRSQALLQTHLSRTWETDAVFDIEGQVVPVLFFPLRGCTVLSSGSATRRFRAEDAGCFTVAERAQFAPSAGYSELVVRLDGERLAAALRLLDVDADVPTALRVAALRTDLPGMRQLRALALEVFEEPRPAPGPFRTRYEQVQQENLTLRAASALGAAVAPVPRSLSGSHPALRRAKDYIHERLGEPMLLADVAAASGVSLRLLQDLFRREAGYGPADYIRQRRLALARELLLSGRCATVTEAAFEAGFNHLGKFSALYAQRYGEPPSRSLRRSP